MLNLKQDSKEQRSNNEQSSSAISPTKSSTDIASIDRRENNQVRKECHETEYSKSECGRKLESKDTIKNNVREENVLSHPLFSHGMCRWTGCELAGFKNIESFKEHLSRDHVLDERSTAQTRVQVRRNTFDPFNSK